MKNLLKGRRVNQTHHPQLSAQWLTPNQWSLLFKDEFGDWIIERESALHYYNREINKFSFLMFFTTELIQNGQNEVFLMGAICELTAPDEESLPKGVKFGNSITIKAIINFGKLTLDLVEHYDITFDNQTMENDILSLSHNPDFESLKTYIEFARVQNWPKLITSNKDIGYIGHMKNYLELKNNLEKSFKKEGYL